MILKKMNYFSLAYAKEPSAVSEGNQIVEERKLLFSGVF